MVAAMMEAAQFDSVCYGADEPESLVRLQKKVWAPVLAYMEEV
jgi:chaperone required for assembly of F1-ATPase